MSWHQVLAGVEIGNKSQPNFIDHQGTFVVDITNVKNIPSQNSGASLFIVTVNVIETTHPGIPVGDVRSWVCDLSKKPAQGDAAAFVLLVLSLKLGRAVDQAELVDPAILDWMVSQQQPCAGTRLKLRCWNKQQRADPSKDFTRHDWEALQDGAVLGLVVDPNTPPPKPRHQGPAPAIAPAIAPAAMAAPVMPAAQPAFAAPPAGQPGQVPPVAFPSFAVPGAAPALDPAFAPPVAPVQPAQPAFVPPAVAPAQPAFVPPAVAPAQPAVAPAQPAPQATAAPLVAPPPGWPQGVPWNG